MDLDVCVGPYLTVYSLRTGLRVEERPTMETSLLNSQCKNGKKTTTTFLVRRSAFSSSLGLHNSCYLRF